MKRFSTIIAGLTCVCALSAPEATYAMSWDWVPRVLRWENPYRGLDATRYPGFECKIKNSWGDCVVYSYTDENRPVKQKNYYRKVSSYGEGLDYSDCQYDDYRREIAPRTRYSVCDYGELRTYETVGGTR